MSARNVVGRLVAVGLAGVLPLGVAACGGSSKPAAANGGTSGSAASAIRSDWTTFFNAKTSLQKRVQLLQNGSQYKALLQAQSSSPLAKTSGATVKSVTKTGSNTATVHYTITVGGKPVLSNQTGTAVDQSGTWKVSDSSFCSLLALQNGGKPAPGCPTNAGTSS